MNKKIIIILLGLITCVAIALHVYKANEVPMCMNADEAAFGYNAYSILKTGKDEYGTFLPLRLKSFGDYKLPFFTYSSIPFVALFGLSEFSIRLLPNLLGIFFPIVLFFLSKEFFKSNKIALVAAFLGAISPWIQITSRHTHEAPLAAFLLSLTLLFFLRFIKKYKTSDFVLFVVLNGLSLFTYHLSRLFAVYFFITLIVFLIIKFGKRIQKSFVYILIFLIPIVIFLLSDKTARLQSLIFYNTSGFASKIEEFRREHNSRIIHNKLTQSVIELSNNYISYFSPEFLVTNGDQNYRFGYPGISLISIVEYIGLFIGLYYLFKNKEQYRWILLSLLLVAPFSASLSWQESSLTRTFFMIVPLLLIISYGYVSLILAIRKEKYYPYLLGGILLVFFFFLFNTWDFYYNHYPKRAIVIRSWQCGYKELTDYVKKTYDSTDSYYITRENGEPYIFFLFYLKYPPAEYQRQAKLTPPDEYGFGQVLHFDKFNFKLPDSGVKLAKSVIANFPVAYENKTPVEKIKIGTEEIFWIYKD